jgi:60 kDa SS-A/Ro ribonucleoprotein
MLDTLARLAVIGTFNGTYYVSGQQMMDNFNELLPKVSPEFVAKLAVYARQSGFMKDTPAFLLNYLSTLEDKTLVSKTFDKVVDNVRMLRGFSKIRMSGAVNKNKMASGQVKRLLKNFFDHMSAEQIFKNSVGNDPSMKQLIHWAHIKPNTPEKQELFKYFFDKPYDVEKLPKNLQEYLEFCKDPAIAPVPNVEFRQLTHLKLTKQNWEDIVKNMGHHALRINLNALTKTGVFDNKNIRKYVAERIADEKEIAKSKYSHIKLWQHC